MLSKAVCAALFVAIPGFLSYPAPLNVDLREKSSPSANSVHVEIWSAPATTVVSLRPRWLIIDAPTANLRSEDDYVLTKELQRQLRRLGCYSGEMNGTWTPSTLRAMQTFMNRVNAVLPLEQPDRILLALLQSHPDKTCSKPCLSGENPSPDGRCVPSAITSPPLKTGALTRPKAQSLITGWSAAETTSLEDNIPKLPPARPSGPPVIATVKPAPVPKSVALPPKPALPRSMVATANRERPRSLPRSDQPRMSQRSERESSRPTHSEFARSLFQRIDNSLR
jgi:hypothetical protein